MSITWIVALILIGAMLAYLSYTEVQVGFVAQARFLGKLYGPALKPGPHLVIPGSQVTSYSTRTHEDEFPAEPEKVQKSHKDDPTKKEPFRIPMKGLETAMYYLVDPSSSDGFKLVSWEEYKKTLAPNKIAEYEKDPFYSMPLTITVPVVVEWDLDDSSLRPFIENSGDIETVLKRLNDACQGASAELLGPTNAGHANDVRLILDEVFTKRLRVIVNKDPKPWGINIRRAYIKPIEPGLTVNEARSKAGAAGYEYIERVKKAEADKEEKRLAAEGQAAQIAAMDKAVETPTGKFIAKLEMIREVLGGNKTKFVLLDTSKSSINNLLNLDDVA